MSWDKSDQCTEYIYIPRKERKIFKNEVEPIKKRKWHRIIKGKGTEGSVRVDASFAAERPLNCIWDEGVDSEQANHVEADSASLSFGGPGPARIARGSKCLRCQTGLLHGKELLGPRHKALSLL